MQEGQPNQYTWKRYLGIAVSRTDRCANFHIFTGTHDYEAYCLCEQGPCQPFWGPTIFHKCRPFFYCTETGRMWASDQLLWTGTLHGFWTCAVHMRMDYEHSTVHSAESQCTPISLSPIRPTELATNAPLSPEPQKDTGQLPEHFEESRHKSCQ